MKLDIETIHLPYKEPFSITGKTWIGIDVARVTLADRGVEGRGESPGIFYRSETPDSLAAQIELVRSQIEAGISRQDLAELMPAGGARNMIDCALWEIESKSSATPVWKLAGLPAPRRLLTTYTIGAADPPKMAAGAIGFAEARALKLKLLGDGGDADRVRAVRAARPDVWIGVDANQGFNRQSLDQLMPCLVDTGVELIEQPFAIGCEEELEGLQSPIALAVDESVQTSSDVEAMAQWYDVINIKLDKAGGLTEALAMARLARASGMQVMVGNMGSTSLAMAPGFVVGQLCDIVDLDGPTLLVEDIEPGVIYEDGYIWCPDAVWGADAATVQGI